MQEMQEITPSKGMIKEAAKLREGKILVTYKDGNTIRMETEDGEDPYVWRDNCWRRMKAWPF